MHRILFIPFIILLQQSCFAFSDTMWLDKSWKKCEQQNAKYYSTISKENETWHQQLFFADNNRLYMDGNYTDPGCNLKTGLFRSYNIDGIITDSVIYNKGVPLYMSILHDNGRLKTVLKRNQDYTATYVNSWDKEGNESYLDTFYHDSRGHDCHKDTAALKGIINKEGNIWRLRFFTLNDHLFNIGYFKERLCKTRVNYASWYQKGLLRDSLVFYDNGKKKEAWYFYDTGNMNAHQNFDSTGKIIFAENWDGQGKQIKSDTSSIHALPAEGYKAWEKRLMKKINNDNSLDWKYRKDLYSSVYISFFINEDGTLNSVLIKEPSLYPKMDTLILNACKETISWKACTLHGRSRPCIKVKCFSYVAGVVLKAKDMYY